VNQSQKDTRAHLLFALPPSLGKALGHRPKQLEDHLRRALGRDVEVVTSQSYEQLARELLAGKVDAAWAPPFVCARIEAMGIRVLVRGVRNGASTYRAAIVCRRDANLTVDSLAGTTAAWSDRDSVGGYLLPMAWLREQGIDPARTFLRQDFLGSYRATLEAVAAGKADVTSLFAPSAKGGVPQGTGIEEVWPGHEADFKVIAWTADAPNDGVAVSMSLPGNVVADLEQALLNLHQSPEGAAVLKDCFHAEKFEASPRMGYRALYRVALASL
jgi:phosphonate transport system substrate-binding protein